MKKHLFLAAAIVAILGTGAATTSAFAQTGTNSQNTISTIVQKIADKFGLNKSDVQKVFDDAKSERMAHMQAQFEQRLTQAVNEGKITDAQKQAIIKKFQDMKNNKPNPDAFKNMTPAQRKAQMEAKKKEFEDFAKQNNMSLSTLQDLLGWGKGLGIKGGRHMQ